MKPGYLESAQSAGGIFSWDLRTGVLSADQTLSGLIAIDPGAGVQGISLEVFMDAVHPEDRERVSNRIFTSIETGHPCRQSYRLIDIDGRIRLVVGLGQCFRDEHGAPTSYAGIITPADDRVAVRQEDLIDQCIAAYRSAKELNAAFPQYLISMVLIELGYDEARESSTVSH
jgi:PAS domain-containing protein